ncbi:MAG TPA: DUF2855 family protein [Mycobacteriales bacterium]|nr:DUF2855 family protein [Mycobacteriales bacterium]
MTAWDLVVDRDDLSRTSILDRAVPDAGDGEAVLRVDRVGVTANNVTYALVGDDMRYWEFFPTESGWGRVPLWGFAEVVDSGVPDLEVGTRVYGYLPTSSHLVVRPERVTAAGFRDASAHRSTLPRPYNVYADTTGDPAYQRRHEDLQVLYRPLFITSFMLEDFLSDHGYFGAKVLVVSSASSKTAYGFAFCAQRRRHRPRLVGLTSPANVGFTESLCCYDHVVPYDAVEDIRPDLPTAYVDVAGSVPLRATVHRHFAERLVHDTSVGATHLDPLPTGDTGLPGPAPYFFFAPDQMRRRSADWGPGGIEARYGEAWRAFVPIVADWVDVTESTGRDGLRAAWLEVLNGRGDPRRGHVVQL